MSSHDRREEDTLQLPWQGNSLFLKNSVPIALGTGLIALDIVVTDRDGVRPRRWAGGTCGNVLAILAYLGWRTYPAATLGDDLAAQLVLEDLKRFHVNTRFLQRSEIRHTPIVVEKIRTRVPGEPRHRFVWTCPNCGAWLPGYQAILANEAKKLVRRMPAPTVFFFDRVSRGALELARASSARGALVVFEPSGVRDERLFHEAVQISDVVKYSHERLGHLRNGAKYPPSDLEIETLGSDGLRYRRRDGLRAATPWREMAAYSIHELRDAAGAGDWCTAGVIHSLAAEGAKRLREVSGERIEGALRLGQALAALKCRYEGARGPMYGLSKKQLEAAVRGIMLGESPTCMDEEMDDSSLWNLLKAICPSCDARKGAGSGNSKARHRKLRKP